MIKIFKSTDKDFTSNGDIVVKATRANVHKVDNGDFYLDIETTTDYIDYFVAGNIIVCNTPQGDQAFRLEDNIVRTRTKIKAKAKHIFYDSRNYLIADSYVVNKTCDGALKHLNAATDNASPFTVSSDVMSINSYRCVREPLYNAFMIVLERWGGHLVRDNFNVSIKRSIGRDLGVTIQYRKNLKDITITEDWTKVCTKVLPVGKDGLLLDRLYVYAPTQYDRPFTKTVSFSQGDIKEEDYPSEAAYIQALKNDLLQQAEAYLAVAQYPSINYTVKANVEKITDIGDIVAVYDERLGVSLVARVLSYDYNPILDKYTSVEFGTESPSLSGLMSSVSGEINKSVRTSEQQITEYVNTELASTSDALIKSIEKSLYFKPGEVYSTVKTIASGYISDDSTKVLFTIPFYKPTVGLNINITELKINGFTIDGDLFGSYSASGHNVLSDSNYTVTKVINDDSITVILTRSSALSITGGTPATIELVNAKFAFS